MTVLKSLLASLSLLLVAGCTTETINSFQPFAVDLHSPFAYVADLQVCRTAALRYNDTQTAFDPLGVASSGVRAGLGNLASAAVSPVAPVISTVGGSSSEVIAQFGLDTQTVKKIITWCMHDKGQASGAYHIFDPNL